jgi:hypothetical protein
LIRSPLAGFDSLDDKQKHHAKKSFREEYVELLEKFGVDYDTRYIFKTGED